MLPVMGDPSGLSQALMNLCTNARDAMPAGGQLRIQARQIGNHAELIVSDTGQGMKRKTIEQCFDPFFTTKPIGKGTGLGLSTTYGIVKSHEGLIHVESKPRKGTTITMTFPLTETDAAVEEAPRPAAEISYGNGEIILVEEKAELMRKLGTKQLTLELQSKLKKIPTSLKAHNLELSEDGLHLDARFEREFRKKQFAELVESAHDCGSISGDEVSPEQQELCRFS